MRSLQSTAFIFLLIFPLTMAAQDNRKSILDLSLVLNQSLASSYLTDYSYSQNISKIDFQPDLYQQGSKYISGEVMIPVKDIGSLYYLIGGSLLSGASGQTPSKSLGSGLSTDTIITAYPRLDGGGVFGGVYFQKEILSSQPFSFGPFVKTAIGYFTFDQKVNLKSAHPNDKPFHTETSTHTISNIGGKLDIGISFASYGYSVRCAYSILFAGQNESGMFQSQGFSFSLGFGM